MFGNYYIYDCISPLADVLKAQLHFTDKNLGLLQGFTAYRIFLMVLIGGSSSIKSERKKQPLFLHALYSLVLYLQTIKGDIVFMATGRLIFGLGAESMIVAITTILARWFKGKELSFAFGLNLRLPVLAHSWRLTPRPGANQCSSTGRSHYGSLVGAGVIAVGTLAIYYLIDIYSEKTYALQKEGNQDKVVLKDLFKFGKSFWFITLLCITFYSAMFPFQTFAVKFFKDVHLAGMPDDVARGMGGFLSSLLTLSA